MRLKPFFFSVFFLALLFRTTDVWAQANERRPVLFIPGIIGSTIWIKNKQAWGTLRAITRLENLRYDETTYNPGDISFCNPDKPASERKEGTCGLINRFMLMGNWGLDQYGPFIKFLNENSYRFDNDRLVVFAYDWRLSNFENARNLKRFVDRHPALKGKRFDIVGHSMGGIIAFLFTKLYDRPSSKSDCKKRSDLDRCQVQTVVAMGTPFFGSLSAVLTPHKGWSWLANNIAGGMRTIQSTVLTWPALYELLPAYKNCCLHVRAGSNSSLNVLLHRDWGRLPYSHKPSQNFIRSALGRGRRLQMLMKQGWPEYIKNRKDECTPKGDRFFTFVGEGVKTPAFYLYRRGRFRVTETERGDGTVLSNIASFRNRPRAFLSLNKHERIFDDNNLRRQLISILQRCTRRIGDFSAPVATINLSDRTGVLEAIVKVSSISATFQRLPGDGRALFRLIVRISAETGGREYQAPIPQVNISLNREPILMSLKPSSVSTEGGVVSTFRFGFDINVRASIAGTLTASISFVNGPSFLKKTVYFPPK